jgi:hypothetical protein
MIGLGRNDVHEERYHEELILIFRAKRFVESHATSTFLQLNKDKRQMIE